jgi:ATP sulfurylase
MIPAQVLLLLLLLLQVMIEEDIEEIRELQLQEQLEQWELPLLLDITEKNKEDTIQAQVLQVQIMIEDIE